jgi:hypothetical protein
MEQESINLLKLQKEKARIFFQKNKSIYCPFFRKKITLNANGIHHLSYSSRRERPKKEQLLKFNLLPLGIEIIIIKKAGTLQEYRKETLIQLGNKIVEYWGFVAICPSRKNPYAIIIKVILKRFGNGEITFWSVMPYKSIKYTPKK